MLYSLLIGQNYYLKSTIIKVHRDLDQIAINATYRLHQPEQSRNNKRDGHGAAT